MFSALPLRADIAQRSRHVRFVCQKRTWWACRTLSVKTLNVDARQGGIASRGGRDADRVDCVRHVAVRVFPHVHHHRGDRLAYPADPEKCERALLAPLNVLFSCHRRQHQGHEQVRVPACHWPSPWPWPKRLILMNFVYGVCELFHTWFRAANFAKESRHSAKRRPRWVKSVVLTMRRPLPVFPDKQTFSQADGMSQTCQNRTHSA